LSPHAEGDDQPLYLVLAKSVAMGRGFRDLHLPDEPLHHHAPWGFPLLLAPAFRWGPDFPGNLVHLQLIVIFWTLLAAPLCWQVFRQAGLSPTLALTLVAVVMLNPLTVFFSAQVFFSEMPYLTFSLAAVLLLERANGEQKKQPLLIVLVSVLLAACYYIRVVGLALLIASLLYLLYKREWRASVVCAGIFLLLAMPWLYHNYQTGVSIFFGNYGAVIGREDYASTETANTLALLLRPFMNAWGHATEQVPGLLFPTLRGDRLLAVLNDWRLDWIPGLTGLVLCVLMLLGLTVAIRQRVRLIDFYVLIYVAVVLLQPWQEARNLLPILPFLVLYSVQGLKVLLSFVQRLRPMPPRHTVPILLLLGLMLVSSIISDRHLLQRGAQYRAGVQDPLQRAYAELYQWIEHNTGVGDVLLYRHAEQLYLFTGRKVVGIRLWEQDPAGAALAALEQGQVDYVIVGPPQSASRCDLRDQQYLEPILTAEPSRFNLVYETSPAIRVYRVLK